MSLLNLLNIGGFFGGYYSSILIILFENTGPLGQFIVGGQGSILIQLQRSQIFLNFVDIKCSDILMIDAF